MSTHDIREAFHTKSGSVRCTAVRMRYTDDRKRQILEFDVIHDGKQKTVISDPIHGHESLHAHAQRIAEDLAKPETANGQGYHYRI